MAAIGLPAGVGESCSGLRRVASTPRLLPSAGGFAVEEASGSWVEEAGNHGVGNGARELEVAEIGRGFVGVEACQRGEGIILEHAGNVAVLGFRIGIGDHVQKLGAARLAISGSHLSWLAERCPRFCFLPFLFSMPGPAPGRASATRSAALRPDAAPSLPPGTPKRTSRSI